MLERYSKEKMRMLWSEGTKFFKWLVVELTVMRVRHEIGELPHAVPDNLENIIQIDPKAINQIERTKTKHDVTAFLQHVSPQEQFPQELQPWLHRGLTSYDVVDTAMSLQLRESVDILIEGIDGLMSAIKGVALEHKYTPEIGRTHGIHAEPITFGVKLANWYAELRRQMERLIRLHETVSVGKISGAVGMYTLDPRIEKLVCAKLGLRPIIATQIIPRDIIAEYMATLGIVATTISKITVNLRLLSQTEICEVMEFFDEHQTGSSAMPHKKNPIGSENLSGLSRIPGANVSVAFENNATCWHERSLDNSGSERVIIPDSAILLDYEISRLTGIIEKLVVFPERMRENLGLTKGLVFSQEVMMLVAEKSGLPREEAHELVRQIALECWKNRSDFRVALLADQSIRQYVDATELQTCFKLEKKLQYVDYIFEQVFGQ